MTEEQLTEQIQALEQHRDSQVHEVASKFLHEARSLLRVGKVELSARKVRAAENVLGGGAVLDL